MKTVLAIILGLFLSVYNSVFAQAPTSSVILNPNNISTYFVSSGIFNQNISSFSPGFQWPSGSNRYAIYTTGLNIVAKVNNSFRMAGAASLGEYSAGYILNGSPITNSDFKFYKVNRGDGPSNPDWANWYKMVPFGAPYVDINNNGVFDPNIDTPGVKNAQQTIFICMTDGFPSTHNGTVGFLGGTAPIFAELHLTAWGYSNLNYSDMQFINMGIINKGNYAWDSTYFGIYCDPDLGNPIDDYVGCDTSRQLAFCYNGTNNDGTGNPPSYGVNPPAVGLVLLRGAYNRSVNPVINLRMTSFRAEINFGSQAGPCESNYITTPIQVYNLLKGLKEDGSHFMNPTTTPPTPTKYCFLEPGWREYQGWIHNCGGDTGQIIPSTGPGDRKFLFSTGAGNLIINPGDTQNIALCQLITRGTNNLNSITRLKQLTDGATAFYNSEFTFHTVSGSVRYIDNNQPVTSGLVKAVRFNWYTGGISVLDSAYLQSNGTYLLSHVPQDSVDIGLYPVTTPPRDYVISYYPSTIYWQQASVLFPTENLTNINLGAVRMNVVTTGNAVNGRVTGIFDSNYVNLKDANLYAKNGNTFVQCSSSDFNGRYNLGSLPAGNLRIIVNRFGFTCDSMNVNLSSNNIIDSVNFLLNRVSVGISQIGSSIPEKFIMSQNFPNPFNPVTNIKFDLPDNGKVKLMIYNLLGQETAVLVNQSMDAGSYSVTWNASSYPSGVYFYRIYVTDPSGHASDFIQTKKMILIK